MSVWLTLREYYWKDNSSFDPGTGINLMYRPCLFNVEDNYLQCN